MFGDPAWIFSALLGLVGAAALVSLWRRCRRLEQAVVDLRNNSYELVRDREYLRAIMDNIPDPIFFKDNQSRFLRINAALAKDLGTSPDAAIGKTDLDYVAAPLAQSYRSDDQKVFAGEKIIGKTEPFHRVGEPVRWLHTSKVPLRDSSGRIIGLAGINRDITERIRTDEYLKEIVSRADCILWNATVREVDDNQFDWKMNFMPSASAGRWLGFDTHSENAAAIWYKRLPTDQLPEMDKLSSTAIRTNQPGYQQEFRMIGDDGQTHWMAESVKLTPLKKGTWNLVGVVVDITERKRIEAEYTRERDLLRALMDNVPDSIYFKDVSMRFIRANKSHAMYVGIDDPTLLVGRTDRDFYPVELAKEFEEDELRIVRTGKPLIGKTERQIFASGRAGWTLTTKVPFRDPNGVVAGIVGVSKDISHLKEMEKKLEDANLALHRLAREDPLTTLLNRRTILEIAESEWARWQRYAKPFSVLIGDVDNFKTINDTLGHLMGDNALRLIGAELRQSMRTSDSVGRYGGEEFMIILPETGPDGAMVAAGKVVDGVRRLILATEGQTVPLTISVGVATSSPLDKDVGALIHRADTAMYRAKRQGKNQSVADLGTGNNVADGI